jgi:tetratricopeptide (TPR) repeat protein
MKFSFIISILFFFSLNNFGTVQQKEIERQILRGLDHAYNFQWNKAEEVFNNLISKYPDDPRGYHHLSAVYLWYYLGSKQNEDLKQFRKYSDLAIDKGSSLASKKRDDIDLLYTIGANYTYRAIVFAKAGNYLDAAWATKKSESYLREAAGINEEKFDIYLGLGLYNFAVAQIPRTFSWALKLAGISGDRDTGVNFIERTAQKGSYSKVEAQYYLSQILMEFYFDFNKSSMYLKNLIGKYPDNLLFSYTYAVAEIKKRNLSNAEKILKQIVKKDEPKFTQVISFSNFLLGDVNFRNNNFETAAGYYQTFLNTSPDNDYTGIASYRLALSYEFLNDRETALEYFAYCGNGNMDIEDDIFSKRRGEIFLANPLSEDEMLLIKYSNLIESGRYKAAIDSLENLLEVIEDEELQCEIYLHLSEAYFMKKDYHKSLDNALFSANLQNKNEKWLKPYAYYYAARANTHLKNKGAVDLYIKEAENYSNYDYQNKLKNLLTILKNSSQFTQL